MGGTWRGGEGEVFGIQYSVFSIRRVVAGSFGSGSAGALPFKEGVFLGSAWEWRIGNLPYGLRWGLAVG
jgi:hypothetical protein